MEALCSEAVCGHEMTLGSDVQHHEWWQCCVQAHNMVTLTTLQEQQQGSNVRLAELKQQHQQLQSQLQQQV